MASADLRDDLDCSICLTLYTDPVTLRCGHNFCRVCIVQVLNAQDKSGVYSCPECRGKFLKRPSLIKNITLRNVAERFLSTQPNLEEITGIHCTYCIHSPVPAVRSCLHCEASLCDNHLRVHSRGPEHVLTDPSTSLENKKCLVHQELLKYYCTEDAACICVSCSLAGDHRGHRVELLDEASENRKKKLRNVLQTLFTRRKKTEESVQSLEEHWRKAQEKAAGEIERVTALCTDIRRRVDDLEKKVLNEISRQEEKLSLSLSDVIQKLEIKKDELSRKMRHIEELCNMTDPLTVLQEPDSGDLSDTEEDGGDETTEGQDEGDEDTGGHDGGDEDTGGHDGGDEDTGGLDGGDEDTGGHDGGDEDTGGHDRGDEDTGGLDGGDEEKGRHDKTHDVDVDVITRMLHAGFSDIMTYLQIIPSAKPKETNPQPLGTLSLSSLKQDLSLSGIKYGGDDEIIVGTRGERGKVLPTENGGICGQGVEVNTADKILTSDDRKTATRLQIKQNHHPEAAEIFQKYQVISRRRFTSGRHYRDVEIGGSELWMVGMCYPSMDRRGRQSHIGYNNKSWGLYGGLVYNNQCSVIHDSEEIPLPDQISSDRVRIYLDYEVGQLSFYDLCDPIRHLHTFTAAFTEPLHSALCVFRGDVKKSGEATGGRS
ncbi:E3 ubiquitin/ISG15 ligase TRIM25-like [Phyllobates terribilis]|uniref:E3 ubiquitin/ISG15 ligase TRIM25-like n=1 Tax=Phyllobates terribilis TaxID=111132 RepID=UPI003CCAF5C7